MGPTHQLTIGNPPLSHQMPQVADAQGLGVPLDKAIASSGHCRDVANANAFVLVTLSFYL